MPTMTIDDLSRKIKLMKESAKVERQSLTPTEDSEEWSAVCQHPGCKWRRDGLTTLGAAITKGEIHSRVTAITDRAHRILPIGKIVVIGAPIVWRDR